MPGTDRRHSTSSEDANALPLRQLSQDGTEIIPTRMSKVTTPKPASNPLQFIKTGPCDLYKAAQEQIKKVEEIKKVEKVKDDSEDWQSNLDNWKCSRRKRQEHIIERVVEVKKLELEEHDRNRRRSKTFNEMIEERSSKGGIRKMSILSYPEDDSNDLSDLGISSNKEKSSGDFANKNQIQNGFNDGEYHSDANDDNGINTSNGHNFHSGSNYDEESSTPATISSPELEEYTYERAIQGYMNFAEAKVKTPIKTTNKGKSVNGSVNVKISPTKKEPSGKICEKLSELEQIRLRSKSTNDINGGNEAKQLPKVDVHKRRSMFENAEANEAVNVKAAERFSKDFSNTKSVKERLSNLEKNNENVTKTSRLSGEVSPHIKEAISNLEKQKASEGLSGKRPSNGDLSPQISIKERLNSLEKQTEFEVPAKNRAPPEDMYPVSIKERMSSFDSNANKEVAGKEMPERNAGFKEKLETFKSTENNQNDVVNTINRHSLTNHRSDSKQNVYRSVNRLEESQTEQEDAIEKVQSLEEPTSNKVEEPTPVSQPKPEQVDLVLKTENSVPVSSDKKDFVKDNTLVVVSDKEGSGDGVEKTDKETENINAVVESIQTTDETNQKVQECKKHTNTTVEGTQEEAVTESKELIHSTSQTDIKPVPDISEQNNSQCNISETIVTKISLPNAAVPCPRVNISVSVDSFPKESSSPEDDEAHDEFPEHFQPSGFRERITLTKPKNRVRKLTPILTTPKITLSPLKTVCELQIIEEGEAPDSSIDHSESTDEEKQEEEEKERKNVIAGRIPHKQVIPEIFRNTNEVQVCVQTRARHRKMF